MSGDISKFILNVMPEWAFFPLCIGFFILLSLVIFWVVSNFFPNLTRGIEKNRMGPTFISVISSFYGILLGFVIVVLWQNFHNLQDIVSNEAANLAMVVRDSDDFPMTIQAPIISDVKKYIEAVRFDEWKKMSNDESSPLAWQAITDLFADIRHYNPQSNEDRAYYAEILTKLDAVLNLRRQRLDALNDILPSPLFFILIIGAISIIFFISILGREANRGRHLLMSIVVSILLACNLSLVIDLNQPFSGAFKISDFPFAQGILAKILVENRKTIT